MRIRRTLPIVVAGLALQASLASAQFEQMRQPRHKVSIGFGGGVSVPTGDARDALKNGVNGQGFLLLQPSSAFPAIRLNLSYQRFDIKDALINSVTGVTGGDSRVLGGIGGLSLDLLRGPVRPYVTAGVGAFNVRTVTERASGSESVSRTDFGIDGGAGLALSLGRIQAFVEGHVQNVYIRSTGLVAESSIQSVPVTFGLLIGL